MASNLNAQVVGGDLQVNKVAGSVKELREGMGLGPEYKAVRTSE